jgi:hypothetical protein
MAKYKASIVSDNDENIFVTTVMAEDLNGAYISAVKESESKGISLQRIHWSKISEMNSGISEVIRRITGGKHNLNHRKTIKQYIDNWDKVIKP